MLGEPNKIVNSTVAERNVGLTLSPVGRHAEAEEVAADLAHLDFLTALSDSVAAVMSIDVLEGHVA